MSGLQRAASGLTNRAVNGLIALAVAGLIGFALWQQHAMGLDPCPLCVFQRLAFIAAGLVALAAAMHGPRRAGRYFYAAGIVLAAVAGAVVAIRHLWLQSLPADQVPACGPGLEYLLDSFPLAEALNIVFAGSGECATVDWQFLGLSMPGWTLIWYVLLGAAALFAVRRPAV